MSGSRSNIDKLFGDKLRNDDPGFREDHWENMEKLLDSQSRKPVFFNRRKKIITLLVAAFLGAAAVYYIFEKPLEKHSGGEAAVSEKAIVPAIAPEENSITNSTGKPDPTSPVPANALPGQENKTPAVVTNPADNGTGLKNPGRKQGSKRKKNAAVAGLAIVSKTDKSGETKSNALVPASEGKESVLPEENILQKAGDASRSFLFEIRNRYLKVFPVQPAFSMTRRDALQKYVLNDDTSTPDKLTNRKHQFKVVIGANSFKGMTDDSSANKWGITPLLGFSYEYRFNNHFSLSTEVDYLRRGGNSLNRSTTTITYFHHREYNIHGLKTKALDFIFIPLTANYKLFNRHYFKAGASASFLLSTLSDRTETYKNYYSEKATVSTDVKGYYTGLRKLNPGFTLGYEFRTDVRSYIGIRYNQSFTDITDNKVFKNQSTDKMSDVQLYIRLNAF